MVGQVRHRGMIALHTVAYGWVGMYDQLRVNGEFPDLDHMIRKFVKMQVSR